MAIAVLTSTRLEVSGTDYSAWCKSVTVTCDAEQLDATDFASGGWKESLGGLKGGEVSFELMDDFADNDVNEDFWGLLGTVVAVKVRASSASIGAANPEYQFSALVTSAVGVDVSVGEIPTQSHTWPISGAVTRAVA